MRSSDARPRVTCGWHGCGASREAAPVAGRAGAINFRNACLSERGCNGCAVLAGDDMVIAVSRTPSSSSSSACRSRCWRSSSMTRPAGRRRGPCRTWFPFRGCHRRSAPCWQSPPAARVKIDRAPAQGRHLARGAGRRGRRAGSARTCLLPRAASISSTVPSASRVCICSRSTFGGLTRSAGLRASSCHCKAC